LGAGHNVSLAVVSLGSRGFAGEVPAVFPLVLEEINLGEFVRFISLIRR
jgi:hypothetical protein